MSKKFWKAHIDDIQNTGCTERAVEALVDTFCYAMKKIASTLARKAEFHLEDFQASKERGIADFTLILEKYPNAGVEQWTGFFETEGKRLKVLGMLEKD